MTKMEHQTNYHHRINKVSWWTNHYDNLEKMRVIDHRAHHQLFWNELPHEQIWTIVDRTGKVFTDNFKSDILSVISDYDIQRIYSSKCGNIKKMVQFILDNE